MRKVNLEELPEEERESPKGKYHKFVKDISIALGRSLGSDHSRGKWRLLRRRRISVTRKRPRRKVALNYPWLNQITREKNAGKTSRRRPKRKRNGFASCTRRKTRRRNLRMQPT